MEYHTAGAKRSRRFFLHLDDNFIAQLLKVPTMKNVLLDFLHFKKVLKVKQQLVSATANMKQYSLAYLATGGNVPGKLQC